MSVICHKVYAIIKEKTRDVDYTLIPHVREIIKNYEDILRYQKTVIIYVEENGIELETYIPEDFDICSKNTIPLDSDQKVDNDQSENMANLIQITKNLFGDDIFDFIPVRLSEKDSYNVVRKALHKDKFVRRLRVIDIYDFKEGETDYTKMFAIRFGFRKAAYLKDVTRPKGVMPNYQEYKELKNDPTYMPNYTQSEFRRIHSWMRFTMSNVFEYRLIEELTQMLKNTKMTSSKLTELCKSVKRDMNNEKNYNKLERIMSDVEKKFHIYENHCDD